METYVAGLIILLLVMVYLWYTQKQEYEAVKKELGDKSAQLIDLVNKLRARDAELASTKSDLETEIANHNATKAELAASVALVEQKTEELRVLMERYKQLEGDYKAQSEELAWARKALFEADDYIIAHYWGDNKDMIGKLRRLRDILLIIAMNYRGQLCNNAKSDQIWPFNSIHRILNMSAKELTGDIPVVNFPTPLPNTSTQKASGSDGTAPLLTCPDYSVIQSGDWYYYPVPGQKGGSSSGVLPAKYIGLQVAQLGLMTTEFGDPAPGVPKRWDIKYVCSPSDQQRLLHMGAVQAYNEYQAKLMALQLYQTLNMMCGSGFAEKQLLQARQDVETAYATSSAQMLAYNSQFGSKQNVLSFIDSMEPLLLDMRTANCKDNLLIMDRLKAIYNSFMDLLCQDDPNMIGLASKPLDMVLAKSAHMFLG